MRKIIGLLVFVLLPLAIGAASYAQIPAQVSDRPSDSLIQGNYWALIIGINEYPNLGPEMQLQAPRADAQAVAAVLQRRYGFAKERMIQLYDKKATRDEIMLALEKFAEVATEKDSLLIYFAGHGKFSKDKNRGYWLPSDAMKNRTPSYVSNADIRDYLTNIKARHIYVISDSYFSESLMGKTRSLGSGSDWTFKELYSSKSRSVLKSGGLYPVADKEKGLHSVFAYHLLRMLETNEERYLTPDQIIAKIQTLVANDSQQTPKSAPVAFAGDEGGAFVFELKDKGTSFAAITASSTNAGKTSVAAGSKPSPKDTAAPTIVVTSPDITRGLKVVETSKTTIRGTATDESGVAEVSVNGKEAALDQDGNFSVDILLKVGENTVLVEAIDTRGNRATQAFTINRQAQKVVVQKEEPAPKASHVNGKYYAIVIGNNDYKYVSKLQTARKDATEVDRVLRGTYGFQTKLILDAKRNDILDAMNSFRKKLGEQDSLLIYYAGHGVFDKRAEKAYWLPVDAQPDSSTNWISASDLTDDMKRINSRHVLIVSDSCYSGTLTRSFNADLEGRGSREEFIRKMLERPSRTLMASGGNEPVSDGGGSGHSVFADAFLRALRNIDKSQFTAEELFHGHVKARVAGKSEQLPQYNSLRNSGDEGGDFVFNKK